MLGFEEIEVSKRITSDWLDDRDLASRSIDFGRSI
jgi:hypothetical protein